MVLDGLIIHDGNLDIINMKNTKQKIKAKLPKPNLKTLFYHGTDLNGIECIIEKRKIGITYFDGDGFF